MPLAKPDDHRGTPPFGARSTCFLGLHIENPSNGTSPRLPEYPISKCRIGTEKSFMLARRVIRCIASEARFRFAEDYHESRFLPASRRPHLDGLSRVSRRPRASLE